MSVAAGTRLGPYEILVPLGVGGMGEVYKARDARLVVVARGLSGKSRLLTRRLGQPQSQSVELRGSDGASAPFFSPDGQWVGVFAGGRLRKTRMDGGEPVILCEAPAGRGGTWGQDGNIIASLDTQGPYSRCWRMWA